jgi:hypothetical protein
MRLPAPICLLQMNVLNRHPATHRRTMPALPSGLSLAQVQVNNHPFRPLSLSLSIPAPKPFTKPSISSPRLARAAMSVAYQWYMLTPSIFAHTTSQTALTLNGANSERS